MTFSIEPPLPDLGREWDLTEMDAGTTASKFDLSIELEDRGEVIAGRAMYARTCSIPAPSRDLIDELDGAAHAVVGDPDLTIGRINHRETA